MRLNFIIGKNSTKRILRICSYITLIYMTCWGFTWFYCCQSIVYQLEKAFLRSEGNRLNDAKVYHNADFVSWEGSLRPEPLPEFVSWVCCVGDPRSFRPAPVPEGDCWLCIGTPSTPFPFVVSYSFVKVAGPTEALAAHFSMFWTPWGLYLLWDKIYWIV